MNNDDIIVVADNTPVPDMVVEERDIEVSQWTSSNKFFDYMLKAARSIPAIDIKSASSLKRAAAYCGNMKRELYAGVENDAEQGELTLEQLRFLDDLELGFNETEAQASGKKQMTKFATKSTQINLVVDPFTFAIARICINAKVANGKDIEKTFRALKDKFKLTEKEQLSTIAVMSDMGYPVTASWVDGNIDMIEQYFA